jgi:hypothetical protein
MVTVKLVKIGLRFTKENYMDFPLLQLTVDIQRIGEINHLVLGTTVIVTKNTVKYAVVAVCGKHSTDNVKVFHIYLVVLNA